MMNSEELRKELHRLRDEAGYGNFDYEVKRMMRERLQIGDRDRRKAATPAEINKLYKEQKGICRWCNQEMAMIRNQLHVDHIDPNRKEGFNDHRNKQLLHNKCNLEKGSMSLQEQAAFLGKTIAEIVKS